MMMATTTISPPPHTTKPFITTNFLFLFSTILLFLLLIIASSFFFVQQQGFSTHELVTLPSHQRVLSTDSSPSFKELHFQGVRKGWNSRNSRRLMIGSTAPTCTYNECRGCKFRCRAEQIPVDANDPINSAYHYRCVCHRLMNTNAINYCFIYVSIIATKETEANALKEGLNYIQQRSLENVLYEGDAQKIILQIETANPEDDISTEYILWDCISTSKFCKNISFKWVPRASNSTAHHIAFWAHHANIVDLVIWSTEPLWLSDHMRSDANPF